jgi:hypothetical protein
MSVSPWLNLSGCRGINRTVIAVFDTRMVFVAGNQQKDVLVAIRKNRLTGDFAAIVDEIRLVQIQTRIGRNQSVWIDDGLAILPQNGPFGFRAVGGDTHDLHLPINTHVLLMLLFYGTSRNLIRKSIVFSPESLYLRGA